MDFKALNTQAEFDAAVAPLLESARAEAAQIEAEKYADYGALKAHARELERRAESLTKELAKADDAAKASADKAAGYDAQIATLTSRIKEYERGDLCRRVAYEMHLPPQLADRLRGETEADVRKDAAAMAPFVSRDYAPPVPMAHLDDPSGGAGAVDAALRSMVGELTGA